MTRPEVTKFLEKIKAHYQSFFIEADYVVDEWLASLKDYDKEDVYKKFEEHLRGDFNSQIPKMHFLTRYLTKSSDKGKEQGYKVICNYCKKVLSLSEYQKHIERHNSIEYMKIHSDMFKKFNEEQLMKMPDKEFNKGYDQWIEKLYNRLLNDEDKTIEEVEEMHRIENYVLSKAGMPISIE